MRCEEERRETRGSSSRGRRGERETQLYSPEEKVRERLREGGAISGGPNPGGSGEEAALTCLLEKKSVFSDGSRDSLRKGGRSAGKGISDGRREEKDACVGATATVFCTAPDLAGGGELVADLSKKKRKYRDTYLYVGGGVMGGGRGLKSSVGVGEGPPENGGRRVSPKGS